MIGSNYNVVKKRTTRAPRKNENPNKNIEFIFACQKNEVEGCDYYYSFRNELYGFNINDINVILQNNLNAVIIIKAIDIIKILKEMQKNTISILCDPVVHAECMEKHLEKSEDTEDNIKRRLYHYDEEKFKVEYSNNLDIFDAIVVNKYDESFLVDFKNILLEIGES